MCNDFDKSKYIHECKIRDAYRNNLYSLRPNEIILSSEYNYKNTSLRVDMQTVDKFNVYREWEFKLYADYSSLGQILVYIANAKRESNFEKDIIGVIAAFEFQPELVQTLRIFNLGIELVTIPSWLSNGGLSVASYTDDKLIDPKIFNNKESII